MKPIKRVNAQLASDSSIKTTVISISKYEKGAEYRNNESNIDLIVFDGSLYVYAGYGTKIFNVDDPTREADFLCVVRKGAQGIQGPKGDDGDTPEAPEFRARFDGGKVTIYSIQNGSQRRETVSPDLTGPSWKPKIEGNILSWERSWDKSTPASLNLEDLRPKEGRPILLRTNSDNTKRSDETSGPANFIQWKYEGQEEWTNLISISELMNLALAGVSVWYDEEDEKYHFGHKEIKKASYDAGRDGGQIISAVELGDVLYDAGPLPFATSDEMNQATLDLATINAQICDLLDQIESVRLSIPDVSNCVREPIKTINGETLLGGGNIVIPVVEKTSDIRNDSGFITESALSGLATKEELNEKADKSELEGYQPAGEYLTPQDIVNKADKSEIPSKVSDLENDVPFLVESDLSEYAKKSEIPESTEDVQNLINSAIEDLPTKDWVNELISGIDPNVDLHNLKLKIENSALYISYDNGNTWELVGVVGGSGSSEDVNALINNLRTELEGKISDLRTELETLSAEALANAKAELEDQIEDAKARLTEAEGLLSTINTQFGTYSRKVDELEGLVEEHTGYIDGINGSITDLTSRADAQDGTITTLATRVDTAEQSVTHVGEELDAMNATLTEYVKYTDFNSDPENEVIANYVGNKIDGKLATYTISAETQQQIEDNVKTTVVQTVWDGLDGKVSTLITSEDENDTKTALQELATDRAVTAIADSQRLAGIEQRLTANESSIANVVEFNDNVAGTLLTAGPDGTQYYINADRIILDGNTLITRLNAIDASIENLVVDYLKTVGVNEEYIEMKDGHMIIYDGCGNMRVDFGVEENAGKTASPVLKFYGYPDDITLVEGECPDMDGRDMVLLYDLGPDGFVWNNTSVITPATFDSGIEVMRIADKTSDLSNVRVNLSQPISNIYKFNAAQLADGANTKYYDIVTDSWLSNVSVNNKYYTSDGLAVAKPAKTNNYINVWPTGTTADGWYISFNGSIWYDPVKESSDEAIAEPANSTSPTLAPRASEEEVVDDGIVDGGEYVIVEPDDPGDEVYPEIEPIEVNLYKFDNGNGTSYGTKYLKVEHLSTQYGYVYYIANSLE